MDTRPWTQSLDAVTADVENEFGSLTPGQLNWKVNDTRWSIAQILDHVMVTNRTYYPIMESLKQGTYEVPWIGKVGFMVRFFGNFLYNSLQPDRRRRMKTFPLWEPRKSNLPADMVQQFVLHQREFKEKIDGCAELLEQGVVISSPVNRNIVYTLERAFDILIVHEKRHMEQAREVRSMMLNSKI